MSEALRKAALQAIDVLVKKIERDAPDLSGKSIGCARQSSDELRAALAEPEQSEPVAYIHRQGNHWEVSERFLSDDEKARGWTEEPLYTAAPPRREPLAEKKILKLVPFTLQHITDGVLVGFARALEAEHGITGGKS